jgi:hypothetical protein
MRDHSAVGRTGRTILKKENKAVNGSIPELGQTKLWEVDLMI